MKLFRAPWREARERRTALLPGLGWKAAGPGRWRSPRSGIAFSTANAILAEQLRGGIREPHRNWKIAGPFDNPNQSSASRPSSYQLRCIEYWELASRNHYLEPFEEKFYRVMGAVLGCEAQKASKLATMAARPEVFAEVLREAYESQKSDLAQARAVARYAEEQTEYQRRRVLSLCAKLEAARAERDDANTGLEMVTNLFDVMEKELLHIRRENEQLHALLERYLARDAAAGLAAVEPKPHRPPPAHAHQPSLDGSPWPGWYLMGARS